MILAEKVDGAALGMLVQNNQHGTMQKRGRPLARLRPPPVAYLRGPRRVHRRAGVTPEAGLSLDAVTRRGSAASAASWCASDSTTFIEGGGTPESIEARGSRRSGRGSAARRSDTDIDALQRAARPPVAPLAVIRVGGATDVELKERFRRTEGSLAASRAALARASSRAACRSCCGPSARWTAWRSSRATAAWASRSCAPCSRDPLFWIAANAGYDGQAAVDQVRARCRTATGSTRLTGTFGDLFEAGVIDPVQVTRASLQHAASVAALLLTTEALVAEELCRPAGRHHRAGVRRPRRGPGPAVVADLICGVSDPAEGGSGTSH